MFSDLLLILVLGLLCLGSTPGQDREDVRVFKQTPQGEMRIHLHFPPGWRSTDRRPAIVFFFGGGWRAGSVAQFLDQARYLSRRGMIAARADYRVRERHQTAADKCVEDGKSAIRWLRQNAAALGIDPNMIAAGGGSAGAHIAAAAVVIEGLEAEGEDLSISSRPNLLVLFNPVMNTSDKAEMAGSEEIARRISPNDYLTSDVPPAIIFFGTDDRLLVTGREYMQKARQLGLAAELHLAEGMKHGFFNRSPWKERTLFLADRFLAKYGYTEGEPAIDLPEGLQMESEVVAP